MFDAEKILPSNFAKPEFVELPYQVNCTELFNKIRHKPWPALLDSCYPSDKKEGVSSGNLKNTPSSHSQRYDLIAWNPFLKISCSGHLSSVLSSKDELIYQSSKYSAFDLIEFINNHYSPIATKHPELQNLPFIGGAVGHFNYELIADRSLKPLNHQIQQGRIDCALGFYSTFIVIDHHQKKSTLVNLNIGNSDDDIKKYKNQDDWINLFLSSSLANKNELSPPISDSLKPFKLTSPFSSDMPKAYYTECYDKIINYLMAGDCYQVNLTQRFTARCSGDAWKAYLALRNKSPAPFSAFLDFPHYQILSHSPESFLHIQDRKVVSKPIKGTKTRRVLENEDKDQIRKLVSSQKDMAENLMIVDLIRNDISQNCKTGSIKVPKLFDVESFSNVHHLVSTIQGELAQESSSIQLFKDCFPGGSVTGAPKRRAMEIIDSLETEDRSIYCGSIGYFSFNGNINTNIAIRTLLCINGNIHVWGGGAIVTDSTCEEEYRESIDKINNLMTILQKLQEI